VTRPNRFSLVGLPLWAKAAVVFVGYVVAAELGNRLSVQQSFSTFWPPAGLLLGVLIISDPREWPVMLAAAFAGNVTSDLLHGRALLVTLGFSTANTTEALVGCLLVRRFFGDRPLLDTQLKVLGLAGLAGLVATAVGATIGTAVAVLASGGAASYAQVWPTWWAGDALGVLLFTPAVMSVAAADRGERAVSHAIEVRAWRVGAVALGCVSLAAFGWLIVVNGGITAGWKFLLFPPAALIAWWTGPVGAALSTLALAVSANVALGAMAPRAALASADIARNVVLLQAFLAALAFTSQMLAVAMSGSRIAASEARVAAEKYRLLLETLPIGVSISDADGHVVETSAVADRILGLAAGAQQQRTIDGPEWCVIGQEGLPKDRADWVSVRSLAERAQRREQEGVVRPDGSVVWLDVTAAPIPLEGYGVAVTYNDVTDQVEARERLRRSEADLWMARSSLEDEVARRTAELQRANRELAEASMAKSRFLANVSHELRTPLNSVIGFTGVMLTGLTGPITDEQREQLEMVQRSGKRLLALVNDLLDLTRVEAGGADLEVAEFRVAELVDDVARAIRPLAEAQGIGFDVSCPRELVMCTDAGKLHQILVNLLGNAVKFTPVGRVDLACAADGDHIVFRVSDTGIGIPVSELPWVMDEFHQVDRADGMKPEGTGLGLAISRRLAVLLGGTLAVDSESGQGSVFTLDIPASRTASQARP